MPYYNELIRENFQLRNKLYDYSVYEIPNTNAVFSDDDDTLYFDNNTGELVELSNTLTKNILGNLDIGVNIGFISYNDYIIFPGVNSIVVYNALTDVYTETILSAGVNDIEVFNTRLYVLTTAGIEIFNTVTTDELKKVGEIPIDVNSNHFKVFSDCIIHTNDEEEVIDGINVPTKALRKVCYKTPASGAEPWMYNEFVTNGTFREHKDEIYEATISPNIIEGGDPLNPTIPGMYTSEEIVILYDENGFDLEEPIYTGIPDGPPADRVPWKKVQFTAEETIIETLERFNTYALLYHDDFIYLLTENNKIVKYNKTLDLIDHTELTKDEPESNTYFLKHKFDKFYANFGNKLFVLDQDLNVMYEYVLDFILDDMSFISEEIFILHAENRTIIFDVNKYGLDELDMIKNSNNDILYSDFEIRSIAHNNDKIYALVHGGVKLVEIDVNSLETNHVYTSEVFHEVKADDAYVYVYNNFYIRIYDLDFNLIADKKINIDDVSVNSKDYVVINSAINEIILNSSEIIEYNYDLDKELYTTDLESIKSNEGVVAVNIDIEEKIVYYTKDYMITQNSSVFNFYSSKVITRDDKKYFEKIRSISADFVFIDGNYLYIIFESCVTEYFFTSLEFLYKSKEYEFNTYFPENIRKVLKINNTLILLGNFEERLFLIDLNIWVLTQTNIDVKILDIALYENQVYVGYTDRIDVYDENDLSTIITTFTHNVINLKFNVFDYLVIETNKGVDIVKNMTINNYIIEKSFIGVGLIKDDIYYCTDTALMKYNTVSGFHTTINTISSTGLDINKEEKTTLNTCSSLFQYGRSILVDFKPNSEIRYFDVNPNTLNFNNNGIKNNIYTKGFDV